jgi:hypothetical protein
MKPEILPLKAEIRAFGNRMIRWIAGGIVTATALGFAIGRYVH